MGIPCPRCGREYDVSLFSFGRTIHCTCGARVADEARRRPVRPPGPPRFAVDAMLGRLARWLRLLGYDVFYDAGVADAELARRAIVEGRILLTRDRALPEEFRVPALRLVAAEEPAAQLREIVSRFGLDWHSRLFTRCSECNAPLRPAAPEEVAARVPPRVQEQRLAFRCCPSCGRVYWQGSHTERMLRSLERILGPQGS
jgi:uncharacterized protein with PIN domain